jgi:hypothetical protein
MACNWLQVQDNFMDPVHLSYLHTLSSGVQFLMEDGRLSPEYGILAELDWLETPFGMIYLATRRIGDDVWVRIGEWMSPASSIVPAHPLFPPTYPHGSNELYVRPKITEWTVPVDNNNTMSIGYVHRPEGFENSPKVTNTGMPPDASYEDKQRHPGDNDAQVSQRPIAIHALEHLGATDRGVTMFRKKVREGIQAVQKGEDPPGLVTESGKMITTCASDMFFRIPRAATPEQEKRMLRETGRTLGERFLNIPPAMARDM